MSKAMSEVGERSGATYGCASLGSVFEAADRIRGTAIRTPLLESALLNRHTGGRILCKAENLQVTGSFKIRGALNCVLSMNASERKRGVVAFSAGNHGQALAFACERLNVPCTVFMPANAVCTKVERTLSFGAQVLFYENIQHREELVRSFAEVNGVRIVHPYDDLAVISGGATVALEMHKQSKSVFDAFLAPCGGGGLIAGCALVLKALTPEAAMFSVEPEFFNDTQLSLGSGVRVEVIHGGTTICDALRTNMPGMVTYSINRELLNGGLVVTDNEVKEAMKFAFLQFKIVLEPGGAAALAAVLVGKVDCRHKTVGIVLSGGNVDSSLFAEIVRT